MTTRTDEITAAVRVIGEGVVEASGHAEQILAFARDKAETAAAHGWAGVAANVEMAAGHLESIVEQLTTTQQAAETTSGVLDRITDQMSSSEVVEHLVSALGELSAGTGAAESTIGLVAEALSAAEAAGQHGLLDALQTLHEQVQEIHERLEQLGNEIEAERQDAETWSTDEEEKASTSGN